MFQVEEDEKPRLTEERYISTAFGQHVPMYHIGTIVFSMKVLLLLFNEMEGFFLCPTVLGWNGRD